MSAFDAADIRLAQSGFSGEVQVTTHKICVEMGFKNIFKGGAPVG